jgi:hypothetical protein
VALAAGGVGGTNTQIELANMLQTTKIANTAITMRMRRCDFCFDRFAIFVTSCFISGAIIP